jgi:hypothetical protein
VCQTKRIKEFFILFNSFNYRGLKKVVSAINRDISIWKGLGINRTQFQAQMWNFWESWEANKSSDLKADHTAAETQILLNLPAGKEDTFNKKNRMRYK